MKNAKHLGWLSMLSLIGAFGCSAGAPLEDVAEQQDELRFRRQCEGPRHLSCAKDQFCDALKPGRCPGARQVGVCAGQPEVCTHIFDPVCGCDGVTYPNACNAAALGVAVASRGECTPDGEFCGGIAGIPCAPGQTCVDDPSDDCDPQNGGADCGGVCVPESKPQFCGGIAGFPCPSGQSCIDDPSDDCDPQNGGADCGGICVPQRTCGDTVCAPGTVCCNGLLGICTLPGRVCIF